MAFRIPASIPLLLLALAAAGCDPNAKASSKNGTAPARADQLSRELESCSASMQCADGLRCFDSVCRPQRASTVGDYQAALGARARAAGNLDAAVKAYADAMNQYASDQVEAPISLHCDYGNVLAAAAKNKASGELAARVLHRCLLGTPVGSSLRSRAFYDLSGLADAGLDPALLAHRELADLYLTRVAEKAGPTELKLAVTPDPKIKTKGYLAAAAALGGDEARQAFTPCWQAYAAAAKNPASVTLILPVKSTFQQGEYEEDDRYILQLDPAGLPSKTPGKPPEQVALAGCVEAAAAPLLSALKGNSAGWAGKLAVTLE
jgi:hypothetical protein